MGRGKRTGAIPLSDARGRRLPESLEAALKRQPDKYDFEALRSLRRRLEEGYADDDVSAVSAQLAQAVGLPFCVVWDYREPGYCGGSSEEFLLQDGALYELPRVLYDLLWEGELPDAEELDRELAALRPSPLKLAELVAAGPGNYALEDRPGA